MVVSYLGLTGEEQFDFLQLYAILQLTADFPRLPVWERDEKVTFRLSHLFSFLNVYPMVD
jgi:hypothetical protein